MNCLLFKRLYASGLAWPSQGLGMKVLAWNKERQEQGEETICKRWEDHSDMETDINETGNIGTKDETWGNRDEWRGVRDVMEIGRTLEWKGIVEEGGVEQTCWRFISDWYLTPHSWWMGGRLDPSSISGSIGQKWVLNQNPRTHMGCPRQLVFFYPASAGLWAPFGVPWAWLQAQ